MFKAGKVGETKQEGREGREESRLVCAAQGEASDSVFQHGVVKVDKQSDGRIEQLHVAEELGDMDREDFFHRLGLDDEAPVYIEIQAERLLEREVLVANRHDEFTNGRYLTERELMHETSLVDAFDEPGTLVAMNFNRTADHVRRPTISAFEIWVHRFSSRSFRPSCLKDSDF